MGKVTTKNPQIETCEKVRCGNGFLATAARFRRQLAACASSPHYIRLLKAANSHAARKPFPHLTFSIFLILNLFVIWVSFSHASPKSAYHWNLLADGIVYAKYSFEAGPQERTTIHAFEIDPAKVRLNVVIAGKNKPEGTTVDDLASRNKAALVINGGFFTEERKSIGLLVQSGKTINPIHKTSWWSIFGLKNGVPFIATPKEFVPSADISMAVQAGPRLVVDGAVPKLKDDFAPRSAVGITKGNNVILVVTEGIPISLKELAKRMKISRFEGGLECPNAMALDGGGSTQLYAKIKKFELSIEGLSYITNGIAAFLK